MQQRMQRQCCTRGRLRPARPRPFAEVFMLEPPARRFLCARCRAPVLVCSACDRGQIYCASGCSALARRQAQHASAQRYQRTRCGRFMHAARTRRWRERQAAVLAGPLAVSPAQSVTHQGSQLAPPDAVLVSHPPLSCDASAAPAQPCLTPIVGSTSTSVPTSAPISITTAPVWRCHWCLTPCTDSVRLDFLRHSGPARSVSRRREHTHGHSP
jgi:hypothetical protein